MADRERGIDEIVNNWVQTAGIIMAAAWALYTFVYQVHLAPKMVPVNASINLKLQKSGVSRTNKIGGRNLAAIEINVAVKNPSSQPTHLLHSIFLIYGYKITDSDPAFKQIPALQTDSTYLMKHCVLSAPTIVAWGNLIDSAELKENDELKPGEVLAKSFVFYVPVGEYDVIEAKASIPNGKDIKGVMLKWSPDMVYGLVPTLFYQNADGTQGDPVSRDESGGYSGAANKFQTAHSSSMMSLWSDDKLLKKQ